MKREWQAQLQEQLVVELGSGYANSTVRPSGTGCINDTWEIAARGCDSLFMKTGPATALAMYEQECAGLYALRQCEAIRVPRVHFRALVGDQAVLVMEFIALSTPRAQHDHAIADALSALHQMPGPQFGLAADNFIGRTPQINLWHDNWWTFWCECRMQTTMAAGPAAWDAPCIGGKIELAQLIECIPMAFGQHAATTSIAARRPVEWQSCGG
ncbi:MAG: fructosamine kinase family protein [Gammaproteobacteria bacterium]